MEKILIVDDEMFSRTAIEDILRAEWSSIEVFSARGALEALRILEREEIDLLMTDIKMPGMNGLELLAEVRKRGLSMEVIILSSYNEFDLVRQAMKLGTFDYLFKPAMLPPDIIEVVKKALQKQREKSSSRIAESDRKRLSRDREQFFRDLISAAGIGRTWFEERAAAFGLPEPVGKNAVVVFRLIRYRKRWRKSSKMMFHCFGLLSAMSCPRRWIPKRTASFCAISLMSTCGLSGRHGKMEDRSFMNGWKR